MVHWKSLETSRDVVLKPTSSCCLTRLLCGTLLKRNETDALETAYPGAFRTTLSQNSHNIPCSLKRQLGLSQVCNSVAYSPTAESKFKDDFADAKSASFLAAVQQHGMGSKLFVFPHLNQLQQLTRHPLAQMTFEELRIAQRKSRGMVDSLSAEPPKDQLQSFLLSHLKNLWLKGSLTENKHLLENDKRNVQMVVLLVSRKPAVPPGISNHTLSPVRKVTPGAPEEKSYIKQGNKNGKHPSNFDISFNSQVWNLPAFDHESEYARV